MFSLTRHDTKGGSIMATGTVESYWGKGYGFIIPDGGGDRLMSEMDRYLHKPGKRVTFDCGEGEMERWASNVHVLTATGKVKWYSEERNYGFISQDDGPDLFVHYHGIVPNSNGLLRTLQKGQRVKFEIVEAEKGPQAENIRVL